MRFLANDNTRVSLKKVFDAVGSEKAEIFAI